MLSILSRQKHAILIILHSFLPLSCGVSIPTPYSLVLGKMAITKSRNYINFIVGLFAEDIFLNRTVDFGFAYIKTNNLRLASSILISSIDRIPLQINNQTFGGPKCKSTLLLQTPNDWFCTFSRCGTCPVQVKTRFKSLLKLLIIKNGICHRNCWISRKDSTDLMFLLGICKCGSSTAGTLDNFPQYSTIIWPTGLWRSCCRRSLLWRPVLS